MARLPSTVPELIKLLDEKYPNRTIKIGESELEAHRYAGAREVVDFLLTAHQLDERRELNRNDLEGI